MLHEEIFRAAVVHYFSCLAAEHPDENVSVDAFLFDHVTIDPYQSI